MIKSYGFWCLQYDDSNLGDEDYCTFKLEKELYYDHSKKLWVKRNEYTGSWYPADFPCRSLKAAKRHLREIVGEELRIAKGLTNGNTGLFNSGSYNIGYCNSGDYNSGDCNSGYYNSGDCNSGVYNTGYRNSGGRNSGDRNTGSYNSGSYNSGHRNSGVYNTGDYNSGVFNKTNNSNGVFCNKEPKICIFNIQTDWTLEEFYASKYCYAIMSSDFPLTELEENSLKNHTYEEACRRWWSGMSAENKAIIKDIPNFDIDVFCDITGIEKKDV